MSKEGRNPISVRCMNNDAENVVSDADGMDVASSCYTRVLCVLCVSYLKIHRDISQRLDKQMTLQVQ